MKYKINKGFVNQIIGGKLTIFDGEKSLLYTFNETATYVFGKIKLGADKNSIIAGLIKRYKITKKVAEEDFDELIEDLKTKKIIN